MVNIKDYVTTTELELIERWIGVQHISDTKAIINRYSLSIDVNETEDALTNLFSYIVDFLEKEKIKENT